MEYKPPFPLANVMYGDGPIIFLGGSIEQGKCENWQAPLAATLVSHGFTVLNPRRDQWDETWEQSLENPLFVEQVNWELDALTFCDVGLIYFHPKTQAPISLLELGLFASSERLIVVCPSGYWRKGNVDIVCQRFNIRNYNSLAQATEYLLTRDKDLLRFDTKVSL